MGALYPRVFLYKRMKEMDDKEAIEMNIADTIMEKPVSFLIGRRRFYLYPPTLGKNYLLSRLTNGLGVNKQILSSNPYLEAYRLASEKKELVCRILAYHSLKRKCDIQNDGIVSQRADYFRKKLNDEELAQLLVMTFSQENVSEYIVHLGLDKEHAERSRIMAIKKNTGNLSFCGKSTYGTIIDWACQRYGWSMEYVVWGISYANLQMLMADSITSVYLSPEERKKLGITDNLEIINADDPKNRDLILSLLKEKS